MKVDDIALIVNGFQELMREQEYELIDMILAKCLSEKSSIEFLVICLRTTYTIKDKLPSWEHTLEQAIIWIAEKGRDPKTVLVGLME